MGRKTAAILLSIVLPFLTVVPVWGQGSHGVGLCMAGVKLMAESGWNYQNILKHYYTGVEVTTWDTNRNIRVGVHSHESAITLIGNSAFTVEGLNLSGNAGESATVTYNGQYNVALSNGQSGISPNPVRINPGSGTLQVNGWLSWNSRNREVRGLVEVRYITDSVTSSDNNKLWAINELPLEEYVTGVLEEPDSWPFEGLKVLAVAARTYALNKILYGGKHRNSSGNIFDVCATGHCQQYIGYWNGPNHRAAQEQTIGQVVTYAGNPIVAAYSGSCPGGRTKSSEEAGWSYYPYLRSVSCPHSSNSSSIPPGEVYGRVISSITRKAISGTAVRLGNQVVPTNANGEFRLTNVPPGNYIIYYDAPGYQGQTQEGIVVNSNLTATPPMVILSPPTGEILGRVLDRSHRPVPGTAVRINASVVPPNPGGEFRFTRIHNGAYTIYYDAPGYQGQSQENIVVNGGLIRPPTALLSKVTGEIRGFVLDNRTRGPIPGTVVRINNVIMPTNPGGEFRFTLVHNGIYTIYYDAPDYAGQIQQNIVVDGGVTSTPTVLMMPR